jgi:hypothetical protein
MGDAPLTTYPHPLDGIVRLVKDLLAAAEATGQTVRLAAHLPVVWHQGQHLIHHGTPDEQLEGYALLLEVIAKTPGVLPVLMRYLVDAYTDQTLAHPLTA